jgi:hypothetical protein
MVDPAFAHTGAANQSRSEFIGGCLVGWDVLALFAKIIGVGAILRRMSSG